MFYPHFLLENLSAAPNKLSTAFRQNPSHKHAILFLIQYTFEFVSQIPRTISQTPKTMDLVSITKIQGVSKMYDLKWKKSAGEDGSLVKDTRVVEERFQKTRSQTTKKGGGEMLVECRATLEKDEGKKLIMVGDEWVLTDSRVVVFSERSATDEAKNPKRKADEVDEAFNTPDEFNNDVITNNVCLQTAEDNSSPTAKISNPNTQSNPIPKLFKNSHQSSPESVPVFWFEPHYCKKCKRAFVDESELLQHKATHAKKDRELRPTGRRTCDEPGCGKSFPYPQKLVEHRRMHTGVRPFVCTFPNCAKKYPRKFALTRHLETHVRSTNKSVTAIRDELRRMKN